MAFEIFFLYNGDEGSSTSENYYKRRFNEADFKKKTKEEQEKGDKLICVAK